MYFCLQRASFSIFSSVFNQNQNGNSAEFIMEPLQLIQHGF